MKNQNYFIGLDIGTNSVGYAVTDEDHNLLKFRGEAMWGSHIFEEAKQCAERRGFRTARRRTARRKQRVRLVQEIFAREIAKVDENFFVRLKESALFAEDKTNKDPFSYFVDKDFTDKDFHRKYPTIHHLTMSIIEDKTYHDPRLVYLAVAWLVAHRGHFLCEVSKDDVKSILNFNTVYNDLLDYAENNGLEIYLTKDMAEGLKEILLLKVGVTLKKAKIKESLFDSKEEKPTEETFISQKELITLLAGGQTDTSKLFPSIDDEDKQSVSLAKNEEEFIALLATLDDANAEILRRLRAIYEWSLLSEAISGEKYISQAKKKVYDNHCEDLENLKKLVHKYLGKDGYKKVFKRATQNNYVCYSYNLKSLSAEEKNKVGKATKEDFCAFVKKEILSKITPNPEDKVLYDNIKDKVEAITFMPKQVNGDNRVIPYQLYYAELKEILQNASGYLPFLTEKDEDGYTPMEKLLSIMEFRIPYYVGPLHRDKKSKIAWITKKATGQIRPWNFMDKVDLEQCEQDFINRMTCTCTYMVGENVLPKHSMLYEKYTVLNEINKLKINGVPITVEAKQKIFEDLFCQRRKVTPKALNEFMTTNGMKQKDDVLTGIDIEYKINSSLSSYHDFKRFLEAKLLTEEQIEEIIERITYVSDNRRLKKWLAETFSFLSQEDINYISRLHYTDFGRLSKRFLSEKFAQDEKGQPTSIIGALWNTNYNLMELIYHKGFTFGKELEQHRNEYYADPSHPATVNSIMEELYISNAVKRPIFRTLDIVKDIEKAMGHAPSKIFVEMARGGQTEKKRTTSRLDQIKAYYKTFPKSEVKQLDQLINELNGVTNNELQSRKLFLYFMQLGKCMYSGEAINLSELKSKEYDIEHIFPQCYVKDDSFDNIVLVNSRLNGQKSDTYPIQKEIRSKMYGFWKNLLDKNLISKKKYERLTRSTPFTDDEREGFINRQLVETRQSTKAVIEILRSRYEKQIADGKLSEEKFPEIVYVKAGLVSDFRHEYNLPKARTINDLHHAKDAYLNIVCGDVYNSRFTKNFIKTRHGDTRYSIKTRTVFENEVRCGNKLVWNGEGDVAKAIKTLSKNNIHLTRFAFERKGGLFDQMPLSASAGLLPRKKGLDTEKYGGYAKTTCSFFMLVAYTECGKKNKRDMMLVPIELMVAERVKKDTNFALQYVEQEIKRIFNIEKVKDISLPLGTRPIKINSVLSLDGCKFAITGKGGGGKRTDMVSLMSLLLQKDAEAYVRKIERFFEKNEKNDSIFVDGEHDGISKERNEELYRLLLSKISCFPFVKILEEQKPVLENGLDTYFVKLDIEDQLKVLSNIIPLFMTNRSRGSDLTALKGVARAAEFAKSTKLSNLFKKFKEVKIIDTSASGLFESKTKDLRNYL